jgi:hypothetical protein
MDPVPERSGISVTGQSDPHFAENRAGWGTAEERVKPVPGARTGGCGPLRPERAKARKHFSLFRDQRNYNTVIYSEPPHVIVWAIHVAEGRQDPVPVTGT